jgi:hypothetical protein
MTASALTFKVNDTFAIRQLNGKVHEYKKGRVLSAETYNKLGEEFKARCKAVGEKVKAPKAEGQRNTRNPWTRAEYENLVELYLEHIRPDGTADHTLIASLHCETFPERAHSGAHMAVDQIRAHDAYVPQVGLESATVNLLGVLADTDPERFWVAVEMLLEKAV